MPKIIDGVPITDSNRFTVFVDHRDELGMLDLRKWLKHFIFGGIPATLAFTEKGYAVYRLDMTLVDDDDS